MRSGLVCREGAHPTRNTALVSLGGYFRIVKSVAHHRKQKVKLTNEQLENLTVLHVNI